MAKRQRKDISQAQQIMNEMDTDYERLNRTTIYVPRYLRKVLNIYTSFKDFNSKTQFIWESLERIIAEDKEFLRFIENAPPHIRDSASYLIKHYNEVKKK